MPKNELLVIAMFLMALFVAVFLAGCAYTAFACDDMNSPLCKCSQGNVQYCGSAQPYRKK
jgi:hypothetical protein